MSFPTECGSSSWVTCGSPISWCSRVASVIGVGEEPGRPLLETLADALRPRRLLLALDNCEHLIDACAWVGQRLLASSPGLRLITTSRQPLRVAAETVWQVPPLSVAPAGELVHPRTPAGTRRSACSPTGPRRRLPDSPSARPTPERSRRCAARWMACRWRSSWRLPGSGRCQWSRSGRAWVTASRCSPAGDRTAPPRQRTLRATIDWSHDLLTTTEQVLLRRLSVFAGWSLEMAEQVCSDEDIPAADMLDLIAALVDKSLVVLEPEVLGQARYRLLDTIREYAAARLAEAGEAVIPSQARRLHGEGGGA